MNQARTTAPSDGILESARRVIQTEAAAIAALEARLDQKFLRAVEVMLNAPGRVIVSGIGKSGIIARKVAATLTSTGTPAIFLHPLDALHGDLGVVGVSDVALLLSKSGESEELLKLLECLCRFGSTIIALAGRVDSTLGREAQIVLDCGVAEEACPYDLAPTSSTTAMLAMGDALAVALLLRRGFREEDFARLHPGGTLGRRLLRVREVMVSDGIPVLLPTATMRDCVPLLAERRGTVVIVNREGGLLGVVTAGDLTRLMEKSDDFLGVPVEQVMTRTPRTAQAEEFAAHAVGVMERHGVMALPVLDPEQRVVGIVHLHDLMRARAV
ncbi:MAG TPA: KpsF/GutQ family sugar-phosphate isomerase [Gemmatimonadales bacterium]|nr:KpsF/GutQ family sugar-phosphate isomerase [Gemmatimonadales bacterium]